MEVLSGPVRRQAEPLSLFALEVVTVEVEAGIILDFYQPAAWI